LRSERARAALAVSGIAVAVVLVTLMTGLGYGMTQAGTDALTYIDQDLWATAGPLQLAPGTVGGIQNSLLDAHETQREIESRPEVASAEAMAFQSVYVSATTDNFTTVVGVGVTGNGSGVKLNAFERGDRHYANGSYDGPMTNAVILSRRTADRLGVSTGETVYVGGTLASARRNAFTVVGVNQRFATFLGAPTAVLHLSELQTITGRTGSDRASMIGIRVRDGAAPAAVADDIERAHPTLRVRTQQQQFRAVFENQGAILASAATLVILALVVGIGLVANTLGLVVYQQRRELAALRAVGVRTRTLVGVVGAQGLVLSVLGATLGLAATPVAAAGINRIVERLVGFAALIKLPLWVFGVGTAVALAIGLVGASLAGVRLAGTKPGVYLDR
jgi:putative ABC transport system permease protein